MVNRTSKKITSLQNPLVKHLVKLQQNRAYREEAREVVVVGEKVVHELSAVLKPSLVLLQEGKTSPLACPTFTVSLEVMKKITLLASPPTLCALFPLPSPSSLEKKKWIVACDRLSDPGNLGAVVRSALALQWEGIYVLDNTVDLFHEKTVRSSRGGSFLLPFCRGSFDALIALASKASLPLWIADLEGKDLTTLKKQEKGILLLGTEGQGQREEAYPLGKKITIPMDQRAESLNVAVAAGILMYALKHL